MRITDFKHVSVFILRVNIIKKPQLILVVFKNFKQIKVNHTGQFILAIHLLLF